jgi:hypothetical protein
VKQHPPSRRQGSNDTVRCPSKASGLGCCLSTGLLSTAAVC